MASPINQTPNIPNSVNPDDVSITNNHETINHKNTISIESLFKFISVFDGNREDLSSFLSDCNRGFRIASPHQSEILLDYVHTRIKGKAKTAISNRIFDTWEDLKDFLKTMYQDKKHYAQILNELTSLQQLPREGIQQFSFRIESILKRSINAVQSNNGNPDDLSGQISMINQIALNRLVYYSIPEISNQLRGRELKNLNDAISVALNEERVQSMYQLNPYGKNSGIHPNRSNNFRNNNGAGHFKKNDFGKQNRESVNAVSSVTGNTINDRFCVYCKKKGHIVSQCWSKAKANEQTATYSKNLNTALPKEICGRGSVQKL